MFLYMTDDLPPPEIVAQAAAKAAAPRLVEDYIEAIRILRDKKFTFREIAEWLGKEFDIEADHNSVWRAYTKHMDDYRAHLEAESDEELERNEALVEAEANGTLRVIPNSGDTPSADVKQEKPETVGRKTKVRKKN